MRAAKAGGSAAPACMHNEAEAAASTRVSAVPTERQGRPQPSTHAIWQQAAQPGLTGATARRAAAHRHTHCDTPAAAAAHPQRPSGCWLMPRLQGLPGPGPLGCALCALQRVHACSVPWLCRHAACSLPQVASHQDAAGGSCCHSRCQPERRHRLLPASIDTASSASSGRRQRSSTQVPPSTYLLGRRAAT